MDSNSSTCNQAPLFAPSLPPSSLVEILVQVSTNIPLTTTTSPRSSEQTGNAQGLLHKNFTHQEYFTHGIFGEEGQEICYAQ